MPSIDGSSEATARPHWHPTWRRTGSTPSGSRSVWPCRRGPTRSDGWSTPGSPRTLAGEAFATARLATELIGRWIATDEAATHAEESELSRQGEKAILEDAELADVAKAYFAWRDETIGMVERGGHPPRDPRRGDRPRAEGGPPQLRRQPGPHRPAVRRDPPQPPATARRTSRPPWPTGRSTTS